MIRRDHRQLALSMLTAASAKSIKFVLKQQYLADIIGFHFRFLEANLTFAFFRSPSDVRQSEIESLNVNSKTDKLEHVNWLHLKVIKTIGQIQHQSELKYTC